MDFLKNGADAKNSYTIAIYYFLFGVWDFFLSQNIFLHDFKRGAESNLYFKLDTITES